MNPPNLFVCQTKGQELWKILSWTKLKQENTLKVIMKKWWEQKKNCKVKSVEICVWEKGRKFLMFMEKRYMVIMGWRERKKRTLENYCPSK